MSEIRHLKSRRDFIKKVGYTVPVVLTLTAMPAFAGHGSGRVKEYKGNNGIGQEKHGRFDGPPPGLAKKPGNFDFNDNGKFADIGKSGAKFGGRPSK
jgi:hypothetical protein